jgi:hypothetical protein
MLNYDIKDLVHNFYTVSVRTWLHGAGNPNCGSIYGFGLSSGYYL